MPFEKPTLQQLSETLEGDLFVDETMRTLYATDASAYQEMPLAVAIPKSEADLEKLIGFARTNQIGLIPRTAGTSLAGQVVGKGIVVDVSRHFTKILEINAEKGWVRVQPGVIRNELNRALAPHGLLFGPETSTADRAMIGGMLGNNSCGSNSIVYGSTRDHTLEVTGYMSDGTKTSFRALSPVEFEAKCEGAGLEAKVYRQAQVLFSDPGNRTEIEREFPKPEIKRRNTGYAIDLLAEYWKEDDDSERKFDFCKLIAGSEGTLFFATEIKLHCNPLPPPVSGLLCGHFESIDDALKATVIAVDHRPYACELIDDIILSCAANNIEQRKNMDFVEGKPPAILVVDMRGDSEAEVRQLTDAVEDEWRAAGFGYAYPVLFGEETAKVWELRKAGLGVMNNMPGDAKPAPVIEDTAVTVRDLPKYIAEFSSHLEETYGLECVHYAHAGSGEIHLRPILNLKTKEGNALFREVAQDIAVLVKKYRGSLSGEHGDGRLRGEFLRQMIGDQNYGLVEEIKHTWDPLNIFNPNKIIDTPSMNSSLRYEPGAESRELSTVMDFSGTGGILRAAELCNGSGDCRKTQLAGGTMCPSYMATRNEKDTTRARANILRNVLTQSTETNPFDSEEIYDVMDLCLSCKACKAECPSNVDVGKMKAEFLQGYYDANGVPLRAKLISDFARQAKLASLAPWAYNALISNPVTGRAIRTFAGFAAERSLPLMSNPTLEAWLEGRPENSSDRVVYLFNDEFTNFLDAEIGIKAVQLLELLGYQVKVPDHQESGRAALSKGLLRKARDLATANVNALTDLVSKETPLLGIEPSALLSFRDEYPDLVPKEMQDRATQLGENCLLVDEFIAREMDAGRILPDQFTSAAKKIKLHGHCHQKALASLTPTVKMMEAPANYSVQLIPSGCCGMAGSFGYEAEHFDVSMAVGELVLFPAVRRAKPEVLIAAPGTSCRHQIKDGTGRSAYHPVEILWEALMES
ncbi:MAG: FAD-linked oxidase C-terminal domain-containing protein [Verrucomicrobiota bacterium]